MLLPSLIQKSWLFQCFEGPYYCPLTQFRFQVREKESLLTKLIPPLLKKTTFDLITFCKTLFKVSRSSQYAQRSWVFPASSLIFIGSDSLWLISQCNRLTVQPDSYPGITRVTSFLPWIIWVIAALCLNDKLRSHTSFVTVVLLPDSKSIWVRYKFDWYSKDP